MQQTLILSFVSLCFGAPQEGFGDASQEEIAQIRAGTYGEMFDENPEYSFNFKVADEDKQTYIAQEESRAGESVTGSYSYVDPYGSLITVTYTAGPMGYQETRNVQENFIAIRQQSASSSASAGSSSGISSFSSQSSFGSNSGASSSGLSSTSSSSRPQSTGFTVVRPGSGSSSSSTEQSSFSQSNLQSVSGSQRPAANQAPLRAPAPRPTSTSSQSDIVAQIVSQISPLVSQTVNSAVSGASRSRFAPRPAPTRRVVAPQPAPIVQVLAPVQAPQAVQTSTRSSGSLGSLFGDGNFNVRFNTPDFNIEY